MMPLALAAVLSLGADPTPTPAPVEPFIPADCPARSKPILIPKRTYNRIKNKADALQLSGKVPAGGPSYLYQPAFAEDRVIRLPARPYDVQPGDIALSADGSKFWLIMHRLAGTSHPTHSMIVFALPDGRPAILEAGPHDTVRCRLLEPTPHLASYEQEGRVWVRRRKVPITPMQSARLTEFCLNVNCRAFSTRRLAVQLTPLRARGPLKTFVMGKPHGPNRNAYYCSELVTEACAYAGLIEPATRAPIGDVPRDLFFGDSKNIYLHKHLPAMNCLWDAPARWTACPIELAVEPK